MSRRKVTLRLNNDVVERAKNAGMNLSYFLEVKLVEYLALLNVTPRRRFELVFTSKKCIFSPVDHQKKCTCIFFCMLPFGRELQFTSKNIEFIEVQISSCLMDVRMIKY